MKNQTVGSNKTITAAAAQSINVGSGRLSSIAFSVMRTEIVTGEPLETSRRLLSAATVARDY